MDLQSGPDPPDQDFSTDPSPRSGELVRSAFADHFRQIAKLPSVIKYTADGMARVRRSNRKLSPELTMPFTPPPPSFLNHMLTPPERRFATATLALAEIKETSKLLGVTINDMVLATAAGALRTLLLRYDGGVADHPLLASVPVSFNFDPDRVSGNYFTGMMVAVPVDVADPLERVRQTHDAAVLAKESHQLIGPELISRWSTYLPPAPAQALFKWLSTKDGQNKVLNLPISNVPARVNTGGSAARWSPRSTPSAR